MGNSFSLYLDLLRFMAAMCVVISHYLHHVFVSDDVIHAIPEFGREAVIIFFTLSGYVISYSTKKNKIQLRSYIVARASRIYSVALPTLLLAFALAFVAEIYFVDSTDYRLHKFYIYIPFHSLFLGELWNMSERPPWIEPYWSLGYEVWYYVLFGAIYYFSGIRRILLSGAILLLMGHKLWLLFPIWLSGVLLNDFHRRYHISAKNARFGWALTIVFLLIFKYFGLDIILRSFGNSIWPFPALTLGSADRYLADYVVGILVFLNLFFANFANFSCLNRFSRTIRAFAAYTFTLYLVHFIIMTAWIRFYPHNPHSALDIILMSITITLATYGIGILTEHRRHTFARSIDYILTTLEKFFRTFRQLG